MNLFLGIFEGTTEHFLSWYLGLRIQGGKGRYFVSQSSCISQILNECGLHIVKTYPTPMSTKFYEEFEDNRDDPILGGGVHGNMIGSLLFLSKHIRPDTSLAFGILFQFYSKPNRFLLKPVHLIFGYFRGTAEIGLMFKKK